jgi:multidrug efflux pump subunit AcrA (membrane-fusion protein)
VSIRSVDAAKVKRGQRMEVLPDAGAGESAATPVSALTATTVDYIGAQVDGATDTVLVRGRTAAGAALRPGQFVNVRIVTEERRDRLVVPVDSIVQVDGGHEVAVVDGDTAVKTRVTLGLREGGVVEVQGEGLKAGVSVVVQGVYGLPAKSKITVIGR